MGLRPATPPETGRELFWRVYLTLGVLLLSLGIAIGALLLGPWIVSRMDIPSGGGLSFAIQLPLKLLSGAALTLGLPFAVAIAIGKVPLD